MLGYLNCLGPSEPGQMKHRRIHIPESVCLCRERGWMSCCFSLFMYPCKSSGSCSSCCQIRSLSTGWVMARNLPHWVNVRKRNILTPSHVYCIREVTTTSVQSSSHIPRPPHLSALKCLCGIPAEAVQPAALGRSSLSSHFSTPQCPLAICSHQFFLLWEAITTKLCNYCRGNGTFSYTAGTLRDTLSCPRQEIQSAKLVLVSNH